MTERLNADASRRYWVECEQQVFSMAGMEPDRYEQVVLAIRAMADSLRNIDTLDRLVASWPDAAKLYETAAANSDFAPQSLPQDKISGAAFAMREREISSEKQRNDQISRLQGARKEGQHWVQLSESGDIRHGLLDPYRATKMHMRTGLAVVSMTQADPATGAAVHVLTVVRMDPETAELVDAEPGVADWVECTTPDEYHKTYRRLSDRISEMAEQS